MDTKPHTLKVQDASARGDNNYSPTPMIRLQGKWLTQCGLSPNDRVLIISTESGKLIISKLEEPPAHIDRKTID